MDKELWPLLPKSFIVLVMERHMKLMGMWQDRKPFDAATMLDGCDYNGHERTPKGTFARMVLLEI
jgi:hypothetical protein